jgi:peptidoglycan hydrolase-like protein with peptidoglycan-binding domain
LRVNNLFLTALALFALTCGAFANAEQTKSKAKSGTTTRHGKSSHAPRRSVQASPTPERYREIQQALATKGYFKGDSNGRWGSDSIDALRRFQHDQNLNETGKLDSVSLIALGLGPKRSLTAQTNPQLNQTRP